MSEGADGGGMTAPEWALALVWWKRHFGDSPVDREWLIAFRKQMLLGSEIPEGGNMSNNAPLDPTQRAQDLLDLEDDLEARHATVGLAVQHLEMARSALPAIGANDSVRDRLNNSIAVFKGEEARLHAQIMRVRMPDE